MSKSRTLKETLSYVQLPLVLLCDQQVSLLNRQSAACEGSHKHLKSEASSV